MTAAFDVTDPEVIEFFGVPPQKGDTNSITFGIQDLQKPFQSRNTSLLGYLEPELNNRLDKLDGNDGYSRRVRAALVEVLPRGMANIEDVAQSLHLSKRTLQRNLKAKQTNFQLLLNETREMLAKNYLLNTDLSADEIAFLLAYQETNSFMRAFHTWTGQIIQQYRKGK